MKSIMSYCGDMIMERCRWCQYHVHDIGCLRTIYSSEGIILSSMLTIPINRFSCMEEYHITKMDRFKGHSSKFCWNSSYMYSPPPCSVMTLCFYIWQTAEIETNARSIYSRPLPALIYLYLSHTHSIWVNEACKWRFKGHGFNSTACQSTKLCST